MAADGRSLAPTLAEVSLSLADLPNDLRKRYRDTNATEVARHAARRMLVVAGPGAGKSYLFLERIKHWLSVDDDALVYVASFVRKLVTDLQTDVRKAELDEGDKRRVTVTTLHHLARSLLERNKGTISHPRRVHIRVIAPPWNETVWYDVLAFHPTCDPGTYTTKSFAAQFHTEESLDEGDWSALRETYFCLCRFYNAVGFADMIVLATQAVEENPGLNSHLLWIVDEYQDFNAAEDHLVRAVTATARGVLIAGDDEQALYQRLKASHPEIIVSYYDDPGFANAMLPFCSRCGYHICNVASEFMAKHRDDKAIDKVYLPLIVDESEPRVQLVGTATPAGAVAYIETFLAEHRAELDEYRAKMEAGKETDPFLLILSPERDIGFFRTKGADEALRSLIAPYGRPDTSHSFDYRRAATYCAAAWDAMDNFALRKVLEFENVLIEDVHAALVQALEDECDLSQVQLDFIQEAVRKAKEVAAVVGAAELEPHEKAARIGAVIAVSDEPRLAGELAPDPIGTARVSEEEELASVLPTAGQLSAVELMTMVGSKGLSAQHVIVIGCDNVNMARITPLTFFVALTRARKTLHLLTALQARGATQPHKFLADLPESHCEYRWYNKTGKGGAEDLGSRASFGKKFTQLARAKARFKRS